MHIAIVTAGGAGMFCGSCMHDNTWARALIDLDVEASLIPTYTPIRVDEQSISSGPVLLGGINVYLDHCSRIWSRLPHWATGWLDRPGIISLTTRWGVSNDASHLGPLTIDMLKGTDGSNRREVEQFVRYFTDSLQPDAIIFSNALLSGVMPALRKRFHGTVLCTLQGDDIFLEGLPRIHREKAIRLISELSCSFDGFLTHSEYYRRFMTQYLQLESPRFHHIPLGIDLGRHNGKPRRASQAEFTVGYFARICPEKGLHRLLSAFRKLKSARPDSKLLAAGYLGRRDRKWFRNLCRESRDLGRAFEYVGSPPTHADKVRFLSSIDVLSVPTEYHEPKGLYVLEALANGTPVIQPAHGAFPELLDSTHGGLLFDAGNEDELVDRLIQLHDSPDERYTLGATGQRAVRAKYTTTALAEATLRACRELGRCDRAPSI